MSGNCSQVTDRSVMDFNLYLFLALAFLSTSCFVYFVYAKYRLRLERLRARGVIPIFASYLAVLSILISGLLFKATPLPCAYRVAATVLVVPLLGVSVLIRLMLVVLLNRYAMLLQVRLMEDLDEEEEYEHANRRRGWCHRISWSSIKSLIIISDEDFTQFTKQRRQETLQTLNYLRGFHGNVVLFCAWLAPFVLGMIIIFIIKREQIFQSNEDCEACRAVIAQSAYFVIAAAVILIVSLILAILRLHRLIDPLGLRHELYWVIFFCLLILVFFILERVVDVNPNTYFSFSMLISLSATIVLIIQTLYQVYVGWDKRRTRMPLHQPPINNLALYPPIYPFKTQSNNNNNNQGPDSNARNLNANAAGEDGGGGAFSGAVVSGPQQPASSLLLPTNNNNAPTTRTKNRKVSTDVLSQAQPQSLILNSVLANAEAMGEFESHLVAELSMEYLLFLKDCQKWKDHYSLLHRDLRLNRARRIYNQYVDQWGLYAIDFPWTIASEIAFSLGRNKKTAAVSTAEADVKETVFDDAIAFVTSMLERSAISRFHNPNNNESLSRDGASSPNNNTFFAAGGEGQPSSPRHFSRPSLKDPLSPAMRPPISSASSHLRTSNAEGRASSGAAERVEEELIPARLASTSPKGSVRASGGSEPPRGPL